MKYCYECQKYHWGEGCNPEYKVYYEEYLGDEPKIIRASDHEDAAVKFAQYYNTSNDYCLMNESIDLKVEFEGKIKFFRVGAEPSIHYSSEEITT